MQAFLYSCYQTELPCFTLEAKFNQFFYFLKLLLSWCQYILPFKYSGSWILESSKEWSQISAARYKYGASLLLSTSSIGHSKSQIFTQIITSGWLQTNFLNRQKINRKMSLSQDSILNVLCHLIKWMLNKDIWECWTVNEIALDWKIFNYHRRTY